MKKLIPFLISGVLVASVFGCQETPKTSSENPSTTSEATTTPAKEASAKTEAAAKDAAETAKTPVKAASETTKTAAKDATETAKTSTEKATGAAETAAKDATKTAKTSTEKATGAAEKPKKVVTAGAAVKSLVVSKLQEKLPGSKLAVDTKDGVVTVTGTVPTEADLQKIEPIVKPLKGVKSVKVEAKVSDVKKP
ncbi:transport-associated protein [Cylindrospermum sp. NIES-4074]|nr:transport-associated protein [Cylindrospermum sp. NIES-4074]